MKAWNDFIQKQEELLGKEIVDRWLRSLVVTNFDAQNLYLEPISPLQAAWFEEHIRPKLAKELFSYSGKPICVHMGSSSSSKKRESKKNGSLNSPPLLLQKDPLDPHKKWENLILIEDNNTLFQFMTELMKGKITLGTFNPIYLWGSGGCGKTHILMALASFFENQGLKSLYAKADTFTEHVIKAIRSSQMNTFRSFYRTCDILLIDDVHILSGKYATQEEFFHTFNALHSKKKQIILSSSLPPGQLSEIEPRLISRFEWGINLPLQEVSQEHLEQILIKKMGELSLSFSEEMQHFLLTRFTNLSSLQKAIDTLCLREHIDQIPLSELTPEQAAILLLPLLEQEKKQILSPEKIHKVVANFYNILPSDLLGKSQTKDCCLPRKLAIYLCRKELGMPFQKIGKFFSRDHSTIMSSVKDIEALLEKKQEPLMQNLREIKAKFKDPV